MTIEFVVFDLGGVIVDLAGLNRFLERHRLDRAEFHRMALSSGAHAEFERGAIGADEYVTAMIAECGLTDELTHAEFLAEFVDWPGEFYPGAVELLAAITVPTASMSNTNAIHWESPKYVDQVGGLFAAHYPSYQLGMAKPDRAIFEHVTADAEVAPSAILFFDDNQVNVDVATDVGWDAHRVDGPGPARAILADRGVLATD